MILKPSNIVRRNVLDSFEKGRRGEPVGTIKEWGGRKFQKQANNKWTEVKKSRSSKLKDFLYGLRAEFILDFDKKDIQVFKNFYNNIPQRYIDDLCFAKVIGHLSNNLPEGVVKYISKSKFYMLEKSFYERESGGYWVGAYDEGRNEVHINKDVYEEVAGDWYGQEQFTKVLLHEFGHKLYRDDLVDSEVLFDLWKTGERVSTQAKEDYEENFCESLAAYLMAADTEGNSEDNRNMNEFKEEFPKTHKIMKDLIDSLYEKEREESN